MDLRLASDSDLPAVFKVSNDKMLGLVLNLKNGGNSGGEHPTASTAGE